MISFNERLKALRKQNDLTQEQLAEYLGVTSQAVSHWECGTTCPDISLLPRLAYLFHVTTDALLGVDLQRTDEAIQEILKNAQYHVHERGDYKNATQILKDGLRQFPRSYPLMAALAESLSCIDLDADATIVVEPKGSTEKISEEIFGLCQKVISECTESETRDKAFQTIIYRYKNIGQREKAADYANRMSHIWVSREEMLLGIYGNDADISALHDYISFCVDRLMTCIDILSTKTCFSLEEKEKLLTQIISIANTIFCDGDANYYAHHLVSAYQTLAENYSMRKDNEKALSALEGMCEASILFDTYADEAENTSPAVRGDCQGRPIPWDENSCARLARCLREERCYDFLRNEPRFLSVLKKLDCTAIPR